MRVVIPKAETAGSADNERDLTGGTHRLDHKLRNFPPMLAVQVPVCNAISPPIAIVVPIWGYQSNVNRLAPGEVWITEKTPASVDTAPPTTKAVSIGQTTRSRCKLLLYRIGEHQTLCYFV